MEIGYASIQGHTHRKLEYNNQDFVLVKEYENCIIGLIADGCGSGSNSEVGSQLGLNFIAKYIHENIGKNWKSTLKDKLQKYSKNIAITHSDNIPTFVKNYLLYTVIGFIKQGDLVTIFSCGDGVLIINDKIEIINQNNRPKYFNNELIGNETEDFIFRELNIKSGKIILGSDGLEDLITGIEKGLISEYSSITEFIADESNFKNPIHLPRLLQKYSRSGILKDDCSVIVINL